MGSGGPIFIHALFRSASTPFVEKFRALGTFCCYQEPFNESLVALNATPRGERRPESPAAPDGHHPLLEQPGWREFWEAREHLRGLFCASFAYQHYFAHDGQLPPAQQAWLAAIIQHAPARPVLQFCRSAGRVAALRSLYGGTHLHLWREPRAQWWSCKASDHLDDLRARIYRSAQLPEPLRAVLRMAGNPRRRRHHPLPRDDYAMFYGLWLDAWLRLCANCHLSINVDRIALDPQEQAECTRRLSALVDCELDLSDIRVAGLVLTPEEEPFYTQTEEAVRDVFVNTGHATAQAVQAATAAAQRARAAHTGRPHDPAAEQNLRLAAMSLMSSLAGGGRPGGGRWPHRWYPKRLHDYVRWALKDLQRPGSPSIPHNGTPAGGEAGARHAAVHSTGVYGGAADDVLERDPPAPQQQA
jgi:hypothetical protein